MPTPPPPLLRFDEAYFERIWGGQKLNAHFGKAIPAGRPIGEAWLISDHDVHESVVASGPLKGQTLRQLIEADSTAILGSRAALTVHGRFPLLLKLLDAADYLSVQVHPDDARAAELGENDVGKTEMWHVLQADPGSELICGLVGSPDAASFREAAADGVIETYLRRFDVHAGESVFVPAGTVHAIGKGILLAEIQQNSDLTYRLYDWGRLQSDGKPRELHLQKSAAATHFASKHGGISPVLSYGDAPMCRTVLAACEYFAAERVEGPRACRIATRGESFHIVLASEGEVRVTCDDEQTPLALGEAVLIPGHYTEYQVEGKHPFLVYYVPDLQRDVVEPLASAGHSSTAIERLLARS